MLPTLEQRALARGALSRLWRSTTGADAWFAAGVGGLAFLLAYDRGGFALSTRATTAIVACWALLLGVGLGVWPRSRVPRAAWIVAGPLAAFALWTFASIWWAESAENAFIEFNGHCSSQPVLSLYLFAPGFSDIPAGCRHPPELSDRLLERTGHPCRVRLPALARPGAPGDSMVGAATCTHAVSHVRCCHLPHILARRCRGRMGGRNRVSRDDHSPVDGRRSTRYRSGRVRGSNLRPASTS
jgi:hypothetical protein